MLSSLDRNPDTHTLETWIRTALTFGELSPSIHTQIQHLISKGTLSDRDRTLLALLQDAIQDGCIRLPQASSPTHS